VGLGVYIGLHPEQLPALQRLAAQLQNSADPEQLLNSAAPWLMNPGALLIAFLFFSVLSPMIEEVAKSLPAWVVSDKLRSPGQGFAVGAISGAAFGLVESLLASANPNADWTATLLVRGGSTMMHIMAAGLTGWGVASFRTTRSLGRMLLLYLLAMGMHGLWNASVVVMVFAALRSQLGSAGAGPVGVVLVLAGGTVLVLLCAAIPLALGLLNRGFRREAGAAPLTAAQPAPMPSAGDAGAPSPLP
jgi:hypothetical protein